MPFPSAACQTCKNRRIKCDETQPACQRCTRSRRLCLSSAAAKQASFFIHVENRYASGSTKRPRGPRSSLSVTRPRIDVHACALAYYLRYHLQALTDAPNVSGCLSESVSAWQASGRTSEMVDLALSSMALAVYSRTYSYREAAAEGSSKYHQLLQRSQSLISQVGRVKLDEATIDACLLAVFFMGRYEGIVYNVENTKGVNDSLIQMKSWCHHDGAMAVLKAWYDGRKKDEKSASVIIKHSRRGILKSCLIRNRPVPDWLLDGETFGEHGIELESDRIDVRILALRQAYVGLYSCSLAIPAEELNEEADKIDKALQDLVEQLPGYCSYQRHVVACGSFPRTHFISPVVYSYEKNGYAAVWAQYFATRMLVNRLRLSILDLCYCSSIHERQRMQCHTTIETMGESLASTIPFCLERVAFNKDQPNSIVLNMDTEIPPYLVNSLVWPLSIVVGLENINPKQRSWFKSELATLGKLIGSSVLESAGMSDWAII